mgnify:CR=1 FL=1
MIDMASRTKQRRTLGLALTISLAACSGPEAQSADLVLTGGSLYSFAWDAPGPGTLGPQRSRALKALAAQKKL